MGEQRKDCDGGTKSSRAWNISGHFFFVLFLTQTQKINYLKNIIRSRKKKSFAIHDFGKNYPNPRETWIIHFFWFVCGEVVVLCYLVCWWFQRSFSYLNWI